MIIEQYRQLLINMNSENLQTKIPPEYEQSSETSLFFVGQIDSRYLMLTDNQFL